MAADDHSRVSASVESDHNARAPYWAAGLCILCGTGLATIWVDGGPFWKGYVLDMVGPAWSYILFRGLYTRWADNRWTRFVTPVRTLVYFILICCCIEGAQYLEIYDATYDPWDLLAYISILVPLFLIDLGLFRRTLVSLLALLLLNSIAWALLGESRLTAAVPGMADADMAWFQQHCEKHRGLPPDRKIGGNIVILDEYAAGLPAPVLERLYRVFNHWDATVSLEGEVPDTILTSWGCEGCTVFLPHTVEFSSPLFAQVETKLWRGTLAANGFRHRFIWCLGFWIPVSDKMVWIS